MPIPLLDTSPDLGVVQLSFISLVTNYSIRDFPLAVLLSCLPPGLRFGLRDSY